MTEDLTCCTIAVSTGDPTNTGWLKAQKVLRKSLHTFDMLRASFRLVYLHHTSPYPQLHRDFIFPPKVANLLLEKRQKLPVF